MVTILQSLQSSNKVGPPNSIFFRIFPRLLNKKERCWLQLTEEVIVKVSILHILVHQYLFIRGANTSLVIK